MCVAATHVRLASGDWVSLFAHMLEPAFGTKLTIAIKPIVFLADFILATAGLIAGCQCAPQPLPWTGWAFA